MHGYIITISYNRKVKMVKIMMQLNSKELKNFRDTLALWHIADFVLADEFCQKQSRVKSLHTLIDSNKTMLQKIADGVNTVTKSADELNAEIADFESKIKSEDEAMRKIRAEQTEDLKKGRELVTDELWTAMSNYMTDVHSDEVENALLTTLVEWFKSNGAKDADIDSVRPYIRAIGQKKASAKQKCTTHRHNSAQTKLATIDIFLGAICGEPNMEKVLPIHKFITVIEKKIK